MSGDDNPLEAMLTNLVGGPSWLIAKVDQRIALIEAKAGEGIDQFSKQGSEPLVVTPLTEPAEFNVSMDKWERTCDNCGSYTPDGQEFYTGNTARKLKHGQYVVVTFGLCRKCKDLP